MTAYIKIGRPSAWGSRKDDIIKGCDKLYSKWRIVWDAGGQSLELPAALELYEKAYHSYFNVHPEEIEWIAKKFSNVYDNNPSNIESGFDYSKQEFGGNHYQDIAIRRCLRRRNMWFSGQGLLEIRMQQHGGKWSPGKIPFHKPELIPKPELPGWWDLGSIESWWQSAKYLESEGSASGYTILHEGKTYTVDMNKDLYFVTSNDGKTASARRSLGDLLSIEQVPLDTSEEAYTVEEVAAYKAKVARAVLCRPVICDDSGFGITDFQEWPGNRVGRVLKDPDMGLGYFLGIAREKPREAYWVMTLAYFDENLLSPKLLTSKVWGTLIGEARGQRSPAMKSELWRAFILKGQTKTLAEMTEEEHKKFSATDRWTKLKEFLQPLNRKTSYHA